MEMMGWYKVLVVFVFFFGSDQLRIICLRSLPDMLERPGSRCVMRDRILIVTLLNDASSRLHIVGVQSSVHKKLRRKTNVARGRCYEITWHGRGNRAECKRVI